MRTFLFVDLLLAAAVSHNTSVRGFGPIRRRPQTTTQLGIGALMITYAIVGVRSILMV